MSAPLTILHLTHEGHGAGSSISIALLARAQRAAGHQVLVGCPDGTYLAGRVREAGAVLAPVAFDGIGSAAAAIAALLRSRSVDVVNAHSSRDRAACRRLRFARRLPQALVMTRRGMPMSTPVSAMLSGLAADRTIAVSAPVARALVRRGTPRGRVAIVHNAVDLARLDGAVTEDERARVRELLDRTDGGADAPERRPVIGVVARQKDHDVLLRALEHVTTPVTLCIVGFEPDAELRDRPSAARHRIVWLPFQRDVRAFYDAFDLVTLPSRHEGLSQGLLEAMALGKPVVTTAAGGNTDLIEDGVHGLLVAPRDARALGVGLQRLLGDRDLRRRLGASARLRVRTDFTIERTAALTEAVYRAALARRAARATGAG